MTSSAVVLVDRRRRPHMSQHPSRRRLRRPQSTPRQLYLTLRRALISSTKKHRAHEHEQDDDGTIVVEVYVLDWFWFCRRDSFIETGDAHRLVFTSLIHPSFPLLKIQH
jgi:hypothetical protein